MPALDGKVAIVTGAGRGIGAGIATAYAKAGADLVVAGRSLAPLEAVAEQLSQLGHRAQVVECDVGAETQVQHMIAVAIETFGRIDILVNNAQSWGPANTRLASPPETTLENLPEEWWDTTFRTGVKATFYCCKAAFPYLKQRGGKIINFGSSAGILGAAEMPDYAANKEAIRGLTRSTARAWGRYGINVNVICPTIATDSMAEYLSVDPAREEALLAGRALGRLGEPERDAGALAVFLASSASDYLSGQTFILDGGRTML